MMKKISNKCSPFTPSGDKMADVFECKYNEEEHRDYVIKTKQFDVNEFIQASNCQTDLAQLRQQMAATGQLPDVTDDVIDYSLYPENIHELSNLVNSVDKRFNALPDSIKAVFGTSDKFLASLTAGTYEQDIVNYYQAIAKNNTQTNNSVQNTEVLTNE